MGVLVFFVAVIQNVPWLPAIFGVRALPLIPLVIAIAVLDQASPSIFFAAFAGLMWDISSPSAIPQSIFLVITAFTCAMLMRYILIRNRLTVSLLMFIFTALYLLQRWATDYIGLSGAGYALLRYFLPSLGYTLALAPLVYYVTLSIVRRTSRKPKASVPQHLQQEGEAT